MKIKIIKPLNKYVDFSSDKTLEVLEDKDRYFWDLDTDSPKIQKELALKMIKGGHAIEVK